METIPTIIVDSLSYGGQVEVLKTMLEQQANSYSLMLYVLIAILTALLGITWVTKSIISKIEIRKMTNRVLSQLNIEQEKKWDQFQKDFKDFRSEKFEELEKEILIIKASFHRLTVYQLQKDCKTDKDRANLIDWVLSTLEYHIKLDQGHHIRNLMEGILINLKLIKSLPEFLDAMKSSLGLSTTQTRDKILKAIENVPDTLDKEKTEIKAIIDEWTIDKSE